MQDRLNFFEPWERIPSNHENQLHPVEARAQLAPGIGGVAAIKIERKAVGDQPGLVLSVVPTKYPFGWSGLMPNFVCGQQHRRQGAIDHQRWGVRHF
jgi:hypothetical protein